MTDNDIIVKELDEELKLFIYKEFTDHAEEALGSDIRFGPAMSFVIKDDNQENLATCVCQLYYGNLHIKYLIARKSHRGLGLGQRLLARAFDYGKEQDCKLAFLETMSFHALEFYLKLGFTIELAREGYVNDSSIYYLRKDL